jgi:hypothetical protein
VVDQAVGHHFGIDVEGAVGERGLDRFDLAGVGDVDRGQLGFQRADVGCSIRSASANRCRPRRLSFRRLALGGGHFGGGGRGDALVDFHGMSWSLGSKL